ncbi:MAG: hypothetical protein ACREAB_07615 [Blastocatellia bacterium]
MKIDQSENSIRRYLLGELSEAEQTAFEQELLADRGKFDEVWAIENSLIDSYARGEMSRADRDRFKSHYLTSALHRERVAIAELFLKDIDETVEDTVEVRETEPALSWRRRFLDSLRWQPVLGAALAMTLFLTIGAAWLFMEKTRLARQITNVQNEARTERASLKRREQELALHKQELEKEIAGERQRSERLDAELERLRRSQQPTAPAFLSFLLTPAPMRDPNAPPPPTIPLDVGRARLLMQLDGGDYTSYQIRLQTVEGREILRSQSGMVSLGKDQTFAELTVPSGKLAKGDYILILSGQTARGTLEEVDQYFFRVQ